MNVERLDPERAGDTELEHDVILANDAAKRVPSQIRDFLKRFTRPPAYLVAAVKSVSPRKRSDRGFENAVLGHETRSALNVVRIPCAEEFFRERFVGHQHRLFA